MSEQDMIDENYPQPHALIEANLSGLHVPWFQLTYSGLCHLDSSCRFICCLVFSHKINAILVHLNQRRPVIPKSHFTQDMTDQHCEGALTFRKDQKGIQVPNTFLR